MQTARATIYAMKGDCEDIHRFIMLLLLHLVKRWKCKFDGYVFGDKENITGAHATSVLMKRSLQITRLMFMQIL
ncbi:hypothetical protein [Marinitoga lauensis]|uniref:hypothetical protein n=1 Tax=Marinitoga lauensis TaxID=2201189 RepID=UPI001011919A|nr:hypothetical protein [Marinitoga lauensis]